MLNSASKIFEEELTKLINNSGITISEAYYIVENASLKLKLLFNELVMQEQLNSASMFEQKTASIDVNNLERFEDIDEESEASE